MCSARLLCLGLICQRRNDFELKHSRAGDPVEWSPAPNTETPLAIIGWMRLSRKLELWTAGAFCRMHRCYSQREPAQAVGHTLSPDVVRCLGGFGFT